MIVIAHAWVRLVLVAIALSNVRSKIWINAAYDRLIRSHSTRAATRMELLIGFVAWRSVIDCCLSIQARPDRLATAM
jgi:hypothetical protein